MPSRWRLYLVRPPLATATGKPVALRVLNSTQRVALTALASRSGCLSWRCTRASRASADRPLVLSRFFRPLLVAKKSVSAQRSFSLLHAWQARVRLLTRLEPPCERGTTCSISSGVSAVPQYAHSRPHFSSRYSRTSYPKRVPC